MTRRPGPEVISRETGQPFPEGTFVWEGTRAWMYDDVPAPPDKSAYQLVKDRAMSGNSIDLSEITAELEYDPDDDPDDPDARPVRVRMTTGVIGATTLVTLPAFPDAYVELDGELMVPEGGQAVTASSVSWRSSELGDDCAPCSAGLAVEPPAEDPEDPTDPEDDPDQAPPAPVHRGGMLALVPADPDALTVPGGDPAEELHLTLAYLGDDVSTLSEDQRAAIHRIASGMGNMDGKLEARVFALAAFNPDTDPCAVYLIGDGRELADLREFALMQLREEVGYADLPDQHEPFVPHVTAGFGVDVGALSYTGPIVFDRVRVALADEVTDYPFGDNMEPFVAAALPVFPAAAFALPEPDRYTPPYITEPDADGNRFYAGHVAAWSSCHTGFLSECRTPPRSPSGYTYFHTGLTRTDRGDLPTGVITFNTPEQTRGGHAGLQLTAAQAAAHYDNTACAAVDVRAVDGRHGIWVCGVVRGNLTSAQLHAFRASGPSGDWRPVRGRLEMIGVHNVNSQGFISVRDAQVASVSGEFEKLGLLPRTHARIVSGRPVALVAAGAAATRTLVAASSARRDTAAVTELLEWVRTQKAREEQAAALAELEAVSGYAPTAALERIQADALRELGDATTR